MKLPSKYFKKDRHNRLEARIAKFELSKGDTMRFLEYDEEKKTYTGRFFDRKVKDFHKMEKAVKKYWDPKELKKYGLYVLEFKKD